MANYPRKPRGCPVALREEYSRRLMGEFGAVSVVSGHIRGETNTLPLHAEILYHEYSGVAAFASASVLALLALVTLAAKTIVEWRLRRETSTLAAAASPERTA